MRNSAISAILLCTSAALAPAQDTATTPAPAPAGVSTLKGVYAAPQADRGTRLYAKHCVECHEPMEFAGNLFAKAWVGQTAFDFFDRIRTTMPDDSPGKLKREEYADIVAYIFRLNEYPSGADGLPADDEPLKRILIDAKPVPPVPPVPSSFRR